MGCTAKGTKRKGRLALRRKTTGKAAVGIKATTTTTPRRRGIAYDRERLFECRDKVLKDGWTQAQARKYIQEQYGQVIPKGTLAGYIKGVKVMGEDGEESGRKVYWEGSKVGPGTLLTRAQEQEIYNLVIEACEVGVPITIGTLKKTAEWLDCVDAVLEKRAPRFGVRGPSDDWADRYTEQWKLRERITQDKEPKRTSALNASVVNETFKKYKKACAKGNKGKPIPRSKRYNADEFGRQTRLEKQGKGLFPIGYRDACSRQGAGDRNSFSGISCNNCLGDELPGFRV